jgi:hypothetical protein
MTFEEALSMRCPSHPEDRVTSRRVPVDVYPQDGTAPYRLADAVLETCGTCQRSWYDDEDLARVSHSAIEAIKAPHAQEEWYC